MYWFSTLHSDFKNGSKVDAFTKTGIKKGQFAHVGNVHFSNKNHLLTLFKKFEVLVLEHKIITTKIPYGNRRLATWNIVAKRTS